MSSAYRNSESAIDQVSNPKHRLESLIHVFEEIRMRCPGVFEKQRNDFKRAAESLEEFVSLSSKVVESSNRLLVLTTDGEGDQKGFDEAIDGVFSELSFIRKFSEEAFELIQNLEEEGESIKPLLGLEQRLRNTFKPLKLLRLMFLIESSHLPGDQKEIFVSLTYDIRNLHNDAEELSVNEFKKFSEIGEAINRLLGDLTDVIEKERRVAVAENSDLHISLRKLRDELDESRSIDLNLIDLSNHISNDVADLVRAVGNDDMVGRRVQDIFRTIEAVSPKLRSLLSEGDSAASRQAAVDAYKILNDVQNDLKTSLDDFHRAQAVINERIPEVLEKVSMVEEECFRLKDFRLMTSSSDGVINVLLDSFRTMDAMISRAVERTERVHCELKPFGNITSNITDALQDITRNLRVVVFNAHLKASRIGRGTGLQALTSKVSEISDEANKISLRVGEELSRVASGLAAIVAAFEGLTGEGGEELSHLRERLKNSEANLDRFREEAVEALHGVSGCVFRIREASESFGESFMGDFSEGRHYESLITVVSELIAAIKSRYGSEIILP